MFNTQFSSFGRVTVCVGFCVFDHGTSGIIRLILGLQACHGHTHKAKQTVTR
jgi:hypothetical protein